jgi:hypothetical protein
MPTLTEHTRCRMQHAFDRGLAFCALLDLTHEILMEARNTSMNDSRNEPFARAEMMKHRGVRDADLMRDVLQANARRADLDHRVFRRIENGSACIFRTASNPLCRRLLRNNLLVSFSGKGFGHARTLPRSHY